jgi:hypothetical protein
LETGGDCFCAFTWRTVMLFTEQAITEAELI